MARFLFDTNSPYAYLAAERIDGLMPGAVEWEPIVFGALLSEQQRTPWSFKDGEREEGVAEIERRAIARGLPPIALPTGWPRASYSVPALRAATWTLEGDPALGRALTLAMFRSMFVEGRSLADLEVVFDAGETAGIARDELAGAIQTQAVKDKLRARTDAAIAAGVHGVPTVIVAGELFWGDDRLEDAAAAAA